MTDSSITAQEQEQITRLLKKIVNTEQKLTIKIDSKKEEFTLPNAVTDLMVNVLKYLAAGKTVTVLSRESEVSTKEAADILNVSRPFVAKLLKEQQLPFRKVGTHHRILLAHVLAYKEKMERTRSESLAFLTQQAQDLNLGY